MNILGIGLGELVLILVLMLVVVGPERLPDLARQLGRTLVQVRNWIQRSPDVAMVLRAHQEIEQELAMLRVSLLEVQQVRNEVVAAAQQFQQSVTEDVLQPTHQAIDEIGQLTVPAASAELAAQPETDLALASQPAVDPDAPWRPIPQTEPPEMDLEPPPQLMVDPDAPWRLIPKPEPPQSETDLEPPPQLMVDPDAPWRLITKPEMPTVDQSDTAKLEQITLQLQAVMADLWALQEQLRQRGVLAEDWQPPSFAIQLSDTVPPAANEEEA